VPGERELELVWRGKYDRDGARVRVPPRDVQLVDVEAHGAGAARGQLVWSDNLDALDAWTVTHRGAVDLAYIDPPFSTGSEFPVLTRARDRKGADRVIAQPAYSDRWPGGAAAYLGMLAPRLERIHALLADHGSLYVHVDPSLGHAVRLVLDEIFGADAFQREIVWRIGWVSGFKTRARNWIRNHDTILFYAKQPARMRFNKVWVPHPAGYSRRAGIPAKAPGMAVDDVWNAGSGDLALTGAESLDSIQIKSFSREKSGYPTQKNESLLRRIIAASSNPDDLVLDAFGGAGTTAAVAAAMGRRFLTCDVGAAAIQLTRARLGRVPDLAWTLARPDAAEPTDATTERAGTGRWTIRAEREGVHVTLQLAIDARGRATIVLGDVVLATTAGSEIRSALAAGVDPVLECTVDWDAEPGVLRPSTRRVATPEVALDRTFVAPTELRAGQRIAILVVDLAFGRTRIDLTIDRARGWTVR
jgi:DNA modification methylase